MSPRSSILIVDDQAAGRDTLEALLIAEGYDLHSAGSGLEALEKAAALSPDLVLLDVMMPGMDGFEVCRRLRAERRCAEVPIILVTALDDRDSRVRGIEAGADDFVSKPFDRFELRARVRTTTRLNRYRRLLSERTRFAWATEQSGDGFASVNDADNIVDANARARLYLGLPADPSAPLAGTFRAWALKQYRCEPADAWMSWHATPNGLPRYLIRPETPTSQAFWLQVDCLELPSSGEAERVIRLRDVTEQTTARRRVETFHAVLSHKLRTPLNHMLGSLEVLAAEAASLPPEEVREWVEVAVNGVRRLHRQIEDVLRYVDAPSLAAAGEGCSLSQLRQVVAAIAGDLALQDVRMTVQGDLEGRRLQLSRQAVELVLGEILGNAQKFHPSRTPAVEVEVTSGGPVNARLQVFDDGLTLSPAQLAKVWTPYCQVEKDLTGEVAGMGIGLALAAQIVWGVGGTCSMRNRPDGPGLVVELLLSLAEDDTTSRCGDMVPRP